MGRPPTSGYCQTCRRRRVKCDKARPECGRCISAGYACGGYELPLRLHALGVQSEDDGTQRMVRLASVPSPERSLGGLREEASPSYFFETYNWAPFWRPVMLSATRPDFPAVNRMCFQAISYGYMGLNLGDAALGAKGRQLYGRVLSETQSLLSQPGKTQLAKLGSTMVLMGIFEFVMNKVMGRAPPHHVGITQILRHCGPETFREESLLEVYRSCRVLLICQALCRQNRCFLEDNAWSTVPWERIPKTFEDRLMDIYVRLPGIAEAVMFPAKRQACLTKIRALSLKLQQWRWDWHAVYSTAARLVRQQTLRQNDAGTPGSPIVNHMLQANLEFDSPRLALDILYYNAAQLYLWELEAAAHGKTLPPEVLSPEDEQYIRRQAAHSSENPLLLPGQARLRCQLAAEAIMTLSCLTRQLATTQSKETVITPFGIGIVFWVLRDQLQLGDYLSLILSKHSVFIDPERVFAGYFVNIGSRIEHQAALIAP